MSNNHELDSQDLRPTTMRDCNDSTNLPGEELPEQDLDAVSGRKKVPGVAGAALNVADAIEQAHKHPVPSIENIPGPAGDIAELPQAAGTAIENIF